ncbi:succinyldiaminopimelate transaminase [Candidatus Vallotia tarda]|uniref:Succinyldiaminopimelate transaminase n=1 Tax=Candidatus Vallotiella hemipterorum TaxID=1177213 RepID=A0A916JTF0_9BURK|nr:succinyldiaminopimelate transaminase [Candidatus Vallotia tarda]CAG7602267.1 Succinyldiaminopimelate transaminase [Candidatus Vallotia tarda]
MNTRLDLLQPYPFEKLRTLFNGVAPSMAYTPINFGIGEPKHPTPELICEAVRTALDGLALYPSTSGTLPLRHAIASWLRRRYKLPSVDPATDVLPVSGSREALFAFAQTVIDSSYRSTEGFRPVVLCPNPGYQIYEGAALLAGAQPYYINSDPARHYICDYSTVPDDIWARTQLLYVCSPGNPTGAVLDLEDWRDIFALSDRFGFIIASDECYSEIYFDECNPPLGGLQAANTLGRSFKRIIMFSSLSKRSNVPGMRSGFVAGDASLLKSFLLFRTYHGSALSPVYQAASIAAWEDEQHVFDNRQWYAEKFNIITPMLEKVLDITIPDAGFYLWMRVSCTGLDDCTFAQRLYADYNVTVLPGSYLARTAHGTNPGSDYIRIALVLNRLECIEGARRIVEFCRSL